MRKSFVNNKEKIIDIIKWEDLHLLNFYIYVN